jgi:hypothetical protein
MRVKWAHDDIEAIECIASDEADVALTSFLLTDSTHDEERVVLVISRSEDICELVHDVALEAAECEKTLEKMMYSNLPAIVVPNCNTAALFTSLEQLPLQAKVVKVYRPKHS